MVSPKLDKVNQPEGVFEITYKSVKILNMPTTLNGRKVTDCFFRGKKIEKNQGLKMTHVIGKDLEINQHCV